MQGSLEFAKSSLEFDLIRLGSIESGSVRSRAYTELRSTRSTKNLKNHCNSEFDIK